MKNQSANNVHAAIIAAALMINGMCVQAGEAPDTLRAYRGSTPVLDGVISVGEYADADTYAGPTSGWFTECGAVTDPADLSVTGWVKHDGANLYFAFDITDSYIYGFDTPAWLPDGGANVHDLTPDGSPWFADGIEIMLHPQNTWQSGGYESTVGDGTSWKVICSTYKSRLGGVGTGGLLEGEPRTSTAAWNTYQEWITNGDMEAAVKLKSTGDGRGFVMEWKVKPNPCVETSPGVFWDPQSAEPVYMGLNIEFEDVDSMAHGAGCFFNFRHISCWAGLEGQDKNLLRNWGTLVVLPDAKPGVSVRRTALAAQRPGDQAFSVRRAVTINGKLIDATAAESRARAGILIIDAGNGLKKTARVR